MPFLDEIDPNFKLNPLNETGASPLAFPTGTIKPNEQLPLDVRREVSMLGDFWEKPQTPSFVEGFKAGFALENPVASIVLDKTDMVENKVDVDFSIKDYIKSGGFERFEEQLLEANNSKMADAILRQALQEEDYRRTAGANGLGGIIGGIAGGVLSPTTLAPGLGLVKAVRGGFAVATSAAATAGLTGAAVAVDEAILQSTQQTRTAEESLLGIGTGVVLGGMIGAGAAAWLTKREAGDFIKAYDFLHKHITPNGLSAEAKEALALDDLSVAGRFGNAAAKAFSEINPLLRAAFSPSASYRELMQNLGEHTFYFRLHDEGRTAAPGGAAETQAFRFHRAQLNNTFKEADVIYKEMKRAGQNMGRADFEDAVGRALRRGDEGENEFVTRAAQSYRRNLFEPYKEWAIREGMFPPDVKVEEAISYFHRVYLKDKMIADEFAADGFKARIRPWLEKHMEEKFVAHRERVNDRIARLKGESADLSLDAQGRIAALGEIDTAIRRLATENRDAFEADQQAKQLARKAAKAKAAGDTEAEEAIKTEARSLREAAKPFRDAVAPLLRRRRTVEKGFGGAENKIEKYRAQLIALEEQNIGTLMRGHAALTRLDEKMGELPTDEELLEEVTAFKAKFNEVAESMDDQLDRIAELRRQMDAEAEAFVEAKGKDADPQTTLERAKQFEEYKKALKPFQDKMAKSEARIQKDKELLNKIAVKIDQAELVDTVALQRALRESQMDLTTDINSKMLARGERAQRILDKIDALDPELIKKEIELRDKMAARVERDFYDRWEIKNLGKGVDISGGMPKFTDSAKQIADDVFDKIIGRDLRDDALDEFEWKISPKSGPLKGRTLHFPDELIEPYLDSNARRVGEIFSRRMSGQLALQQKFGNRTLEPQIGQIQDSYNALRQAVADAPDYESAKALLGDSFTKKEEVKQFAKWQPRSKEALNAWLMKREKDDIHDLIEVRDVLLGRYRVNEHQTPFGRLIRSANMFNYIRLSGRFLASSLPDMYRAPMVYGLNNWTGVLVDKLRNNLTSEGIKLNKAIQREANDAGLMTEMVLQHKMMSVAEIGDPFASGTPIERLLHNGSRWATWFNGMAWFQDTLESVNVPLAMNKIIGGILEDKSGRELAMLGIDKKSGRWGAIADQLEKYAEKVNGIWIPNTHRWDDLVATNAFRNALSVDVTRTTIRPGQFDVPLLMKGPLGSAFFQFRSFMLSANQRIMLAGLQEGPARFLSGLVGMTAIGMMVSYLKALGKGQDAYEDWKRKAENPGFLLGEALDHSGMFPMFFELSNSIEKVGKSAGASINPIKSPLVVAGGGDWQVDSQKTYGQDVLRTLAGPTFGLPTDAARAAGAAGKLAAGEDLTKAQGRALGTFMPYGTFVGFGDLIKFLNDDHPLFRR